jgi:hypothetical protein
MFCGMRIDWSVLQIYVCRVEDYWHGYKLFCYAYYSHSLQHESQFRDSKLGSCIPYSHCFRTALFLCSPHLLPSPLGLFLLHFGATSMFVCHRTTSMAPSRSRASSFAPRAPHIMHAAPPPHRDVLQVGVGGGLQRPLIPNASF